jgi:hypothetical protein
MARQIIHSHGGRLSPQNREQAQGCRAELWLETGDWGLGIELGLGRARRVGLPSPGCGLMELDRPGRAKRRLQRAASQCADMALSYQRPTHSASVLAFSQPQCNDRASPELLREAAKLGRRDRRNGWCKALIWVGKFLSSVRRLPDYAAVLSGRFPSNSSLATSRYLWMSQMVASQ